ncbi:MAG TPA: hypothetical protein VFF73_22580 [Planctomycetota bacterium]|nr:hypothetical protein [Planctomycetota bacterium]
MICFLLVDALRRVIELVRGDLDIPERPTIIIFILWIGINLLLALLLGLRTRAGRYWTQAILTIHVFYLGHELCLHSPDLWLALGLMGRVRIVATVFLDGAFVAYLFSRDARAYLQEGP